MQPSIAHPCCVQLTAVKTGYPLTRIAWPHRGLSIDPSRWTIFMKLFADKLPVFKGSQGHLQFFFKCIECVYAPHKKSCTILMSNWPRTRKFSQLLHGHAMVTGLRPISMLWLVKLGQVSPCGKFMQHLETCLPTAEADWISCRHLVMFLTVFFHRMYKSKYSCYQDSSVIRGWFDYWVFGPGMRRLPKSFETQFRMSSFSLFTLFDAKEG